MDNKQHPFTGKHILIEMYECPEAARVLNDAVFLKSVLQEAIKKTGATVCNIQTKSFEPQGCTLLALLSESHASIHTYPEYGSLFADIFTCGDTCNPYEFTCYLEKKLKPSMFNTRMIVRGR